MEGREEEGRDAPDAEHKLLKLRQRLLDLLLGLGPDRVDLALVDQAEAREFALEGEDRVAGLPLGDLLLGPVIARSGCT